MASTDLTADLERFTEGFRNEHRAAFGVARRLMELAEHDPITDEEVEEGKRLIAQMLPHVTDCDGLVLAIEVLPEEQQRRIFAARDRALEAGLTMMEVGGAAGTAAASRRPGRWQRCPSISRREPGR